MSNFDNIRLEKGLYSTGNFTKALESLDPSENYKGTSLEGLDAYQRQLKRFGIKVGGTGSDVVDKFFRTSAEVNEPLNESDAMTIFMRCVSYLSPNRILMSIGSWSA